MNDNNFLPEFKQRSSNRKQSYKKPQNVKQLEEDYKRFYYASRVIPDNLQTDFKFRDDTANGLTKCICNWLSMCGYFGGRVNTTGTYNKKLGKYIKSGATLGMADITAIKNGKHVSIEVKTGRDKPRKEQLKRKEEIERAGGFYIFVNSFDNFINQFKAI